MSSGGLPQPGRPLLLSIRAVMGNDAVMWSRSGRARSPARELARGVEAQELRPVIEAHSRQPSGVEVLVCWAHPTEGLIAPNLFMPQAEALGLIVPMTRQMMPVVAAQLTPHQNYFPVGFHISFKINAAHFTSLYWIDDCRVFLAQFDEGRVVLTPELTEWESLVNNERAQRLFNALGSMGIQCALDDFGTGRASLVYLKQFRIDILETAASCDGVV